ADGDPGWVLNWTAPSDSVDSVTFFATFNAANGNGNASGDSIFAKTVTVPEPGTAAGLLVALGALRALRRRR
ncbi:MAG: PEP-CTERM sorting domain-containing protein, partial [Myxococcota bacterium]